MKKIVILFALLLSLFVAAPVAMAAPPVTHFVSCGGAGQPDCDLCELIHMSMRILNFFIKWLIPLVAAMLIAFGGFRMVINQGNSDVAEQAKAIITAAVVGLVIIYGGWAMVDLFLSRINYNSANPGVKWYNLPCSTIQTSITTRGV
jgi:uncharacterized membrane protein